MQGINPTGLGGTNLDVDGLVDQLVAAEGAPAKNRLDRKEIEAQASISAFGVFRGALSDFQSSLSPLRNSQDFNKISASSSDEDKVSISATKFAQPGVHSIEVVKLAQSQRLASEPFTSELEAIGEGNLSFQFGRVNPLTGEFIVNAKASTRNIAVSSENNSLRGLVAAINQADFGVRASTINDGKGHRFVLSTKDTGEINSLRLVITDQDGRNDDNLGLSRLSYDPTKTNSVYLRETSAAQDAEVLLDGIHIDSASNTIDNAVSGLSLELYKVTSSEVELKTEFNMTAIEESIQDFVSGYNEIVSTIQLVSGLDPETGLAGPLSGDSSVRGLAEQIRRVIGASFNGVNNDLGSLASIGIETQRDGVLVINQGKLQNAIEEERQQVSLLFSRAGSTSDPLIRFVSASEQTNMGSYDVTVTRLPSKGTYIGRDVGRMQAYNITEGNNGVILRVDGVTSSKISLAPGEYKSGEKIANELQTQINNDEVLRRENISVSVSFAQGQMVITSNQLGEKSRVDVVSADQGIKDLGIDPAEGIGGDDIQGRIGIRDAEGKGKVLTGRGEAAGIIIEVMGGNKGARGMVSFSVGVAEQLSKTLDRYIGNQGILKGRSEGLTLKIDDIGRQREQLAKRLESTEKRLMKEFSSLDATLGKMRGTSNFLSSRLSTLPGTSDKG